MSGLTKEMARAHVDMWSDQKGRADAAETRIADLEGVIRTWIAAAGPVDELTGFHSIRTTPEFLRRACTSIRQQGIAPMDPKKISFDKGLRARALFTMADEHARQTEQYTRALGRLLGYSAKDQNYLGHLSDAMGDGADGFDLALEREGFDIEPAKKD